MGSLKSLPCSDAFLLGEGEEGLGDRARAIRGRYSGETPTDLLVGLARGEHRPPEAIQLSQDEGQEPMDYLGTTMAVGDIISDRFRSLLSDHDFTGWTTYPVEITLSDGRLLDGYHGLAVTGRAGPIDDSLSEAVIIPPPVPNGRTANGLRGRVLRTDLLGWQRLVQV